MSNYDFNSLGFTRLLRQGDNGFDVMVLKQALGLIYIDPSDPILKPHYLEFDSALNVAVVNFQKANGLDDDGLVGRTTWYAIVAPKLSSASIKFIKDWEIGVDKDAKGWVNGDYVFAYSNGRFTCVDVGDKKRTIGWGCTHHNFQYGQTCSVAQAEELFENEIRYGTSDKSVMDYACQTFANKGVKLTPNQYDALIDLYFNGGDAISTVINTLKNSDGSLSTNSTNVHKAFYSTITGERYGGNFVGLLARRMSQVKLFLYGQHLVEKFKSEADAIAEWNDYM